MRARERTRSKAKEEAKTPLKGVKASGSIKNNACCNLLVTCWQYIKHQKNHKKENAKNRPPCKNKGIAEAGERECGYNKRDTNKFLLIRGVYTQNIHINYVYILYTCFIHIFHTHNLYTQPIKGTGQRACWE